MAVARWGIGWGAPIPPSGRHSDSRLRFQRRVDGADTVVVARKPANMSPITDPGEAQRFDRAVRTLRAVMFHASTVYVVLALLVAFTTSWSPIIVVLIPVVGIAMALVTLGSLRPQQDARLANFTDPVTRERQIPGGQLPLPRRFGRFGTIALVLGEIAVIVTVALSHG